MMTSGEAKADPYFEHKMSKASSSVLLSLLLFLFIPRVHDLVTCASCSGSE